MKDMMQSVYEAYSEARLAGFSEEQAFALAIAMFTEGLRISFQQSATS